MIDDDGEVTVFFYFSFFFKILNFEHRSVSFIDSSRSSLVVLSLICVVRNEGVFEGKENQLRGKKASDPRLLKGARAKNPLGFLREVRVASILSLSLVYSCRHIPREAAILPETSTPFYVADRLRENYPHKS